MRRRGQWFRRRAAAVVVAAALLGGCSWADVNSRPLPLTQGGGDGDPEITVYMDNAVNLVANSEVKYRDLTIGSVRRIEFEDWTAKLTIGLDDEARVPAGVTATIGQKSLLGAEYLELVDAGDGAAEGLLADGSVIGLDRSGRHPETEEVLAAASMLMNGGGLPQIRTIAHELNAALGGRTDDVKALVDDIAEFTGRLSTQTDRIEQMLTKLDGFARVVDGDSARIAAALEELPDGIAAAEQERDELVDTLQSFDRVGRTVTRVITTTQDDLAANLRAIGPIGEAVAKAGASMERALDSLSYPFTLRGSNNSVRGDYGNLFGTFDVTVAQFTDTWLNGTPLEGLLSGILGRLPTDTVMSELDPLTGALLPGPGIDGPLGNSKQYNELFGIDIEDKNPFPEPQPGSEQANPSSQPSTGQKAGGSLIDRLLSGLTGGK